MRKTKKQKQDEMVQDNLRLVFSVARKFQNRGVDLEDLIQEGTIGLMRAAELFDKSLGFQFSTYATCWIRQGVLRAIYNTGRTIRLPIHLQADLLKVTRAEQALTKALNRQPTTEEVAKESGLDLEKVMEIQSYRPDVLSLDRPLSQDPDTTFGDMVAFEQATMDETLAQKEQSKQIAAILNELEPREAEILRLRHGFEDGGEGFTLDKIGVMKNLTRERIRQIEEKALERLKHPSRITRLKAIA